MLSMYVVVQGRTLPGKESRVMPTSYWLLPQHHQQALCSVKFGHPASKVRKSLDRQLIDWIGETEGILYG